MVTETIYQNLDPRGFDIHDLAYFRKDFLTTIGSLVLNFSSSDIIDDFKTHITSNIRDSKHFQAFTGQDQQLTEHYLAVLERYFELLKIFSADLLEEDYFNDSFFNLYQYYLDNKVIIENLAFVISENLIPFTKKVNEAN
ncbi:MAG: hypothetical protein ACMG57_00230 [Candidatus Dojkabacteria bacterium]